MSYVNVSMTSLGSGSSSACVANGCSYVTHVVSSCMWSGSTNVNVFGWCDAAGPRGLVSVRARVHVETCEGCSCPSCPPLVLSPADTCCVVINNPKTDDKMC